MIKKYSYSKHYGEKHVTFKAFDYIESYYDKDEFFLLQVFIHS